MGMKQPPFMGGPGPSMGSPFAGDHAPPASPTYQYSAIEGNSNEAPPPAPKDPTVPEPSKQPPLPFAPGDCVILPANLNEPKLRTETDCVWLEITIPVESDLAAYPRPDAAYLQANEGTTNHPIPLNISIDKKK